MRLPPDRRVRVDPAHDLLFGRYPRHWLSVRAAGRVAGCVVVDGWDGLVAVLADLPRGVYHVRGCESEELLAVATRRGDGWEIQSWRAG